MLSVSESLYYATSAADDVNKRHFQFQRSSRIGRHSLGFVADLVAHCRDIKNRRTDCCNDSFVTTRYPPLIGINSEKHPQPLTSRFNDDQDADRLDLRVCEMKCLTVKAEDSKDSFVICSQVRK